MALEDICSVLEAVLTPCCRRRAESILQMIHSVSVQMRAGSNTDSAFIR